MVAEQIKAARGRRAVELGRRRDRDGFTLIELMIVVAVLAILAAIAYPSYQEHVLKSHRAQAKADLVEYAQLAERFHTVNNTYVGFALPATRSPREAAATRRYSIGLNPIATANSFTIEAAPVGTQENDRCGKLTINQTGKKTHEKGTYSECW